MRKYSSLLRGALLLALALTGCSGITPGGEEAQPTENAPTGTPVPAPEPVMMPAFTVGEMEVLVTRAERAAYGLNIWPDGNIGVLPADEGQFVFYAANAHVSARSTGPLDFPVARVDNTGFAIQGIDPQYSYAAGGPVYQDPESGAILMAYHIEIEAGPERSTGDYSRFYTLIGMAVSQDGGLTFQNLGEIMRPEWEQGMPTQGGLIISGNGTSFTKVDDYFYLYHIDFPAEGGVQNVTVMRAPVDAVVQAALEGKTAEWLKYYNGDFSEPGLGGKSSPLELGNPGAGWMSVSYNTFLDAYVMVLTVFDVPGSNSTANLYLIASTDGINWSPRVQITSGVAENAYPTIIGLDGNTMVSGESFYVYNHYSEIGGVNRSQDGSLVRHLITLSSMVEAPRRWDFNTDGDTEGWLAQNHLDPLEVIGGNLVTRSVGEDPYMASPRLAINALAYPVMEIRMKASSGFGGQVFFTTDTSLREGEDKSFRFNVTGDGEFHTYTLDMSLVAEWRGVILSARIDPVDSKGVDIEIDYIEFKPG